MLDENRIRTMMADVQSGRIFIAELIKFIEGENLKRYNKGFTDGARWYRKRMIQNDKEGGIWI